MVSLEKYTRTLEVSTNEPSILTESVASLQLEMPVAVFGTVEWLSDSADDSRVGSLENDAYLFVNIPSLSLQHLIYVTISIIRLNLFFPICFLSLV